MTHRTMEIKSTKVEIRNTIPGMYEGVIVLTGNEENVADMINLVYDTLNAWKTWGRVDP